MEIKELYFKPASDIGANEMDTVQNHKNLISLHKYSDATSLLTEKDIEKGVRASFLNSIQNKLRKLQLYLLNEFVADEYEYFSDEEPDAKFMEDNGYTHWLKPW